MATPLGIYFSTDEKVVSQHDVMTIGSIEEVLVIQFDQEKFEDFLAKGSTSPSTRKYRKISVQPMPAGRAQAQDRIAAQPQPQWPRQRGSAPRDRPRATMKTQYCRLECWRERVGRGSLNRKSGSLRRTWRRPPSGRPEPR